MLSLPKDLVGDEVREVGAGPEDGRYTLHVSSRHRGSLCGSYEQPGQHSLYPLLAVRVLGCAQQVQQSHH